MSTATAEVVQPADAQTTEAAEAPKKKKGRAPRPVHAEIAQAIEAGQKLDAIPATFDKTKHAKLDPENFSSPVIVMEWRLADLDVQRANLVADIEQAKMLGSLNVGQDVLDTLAQLTRIQESLAKKTGAVTEALTAAGVSPDTLAQLLPAAK